MSGRTDRNAGRVGWGWRLLAALVLLGSVIDGNASAALTKVADPGTAGDRTAGATSLTITLTAGAAVGNTVIVSFAMDPNNNAVTCADSKGNIYTADISVQNGTDNSGTGTRTVVFSAPVTTALVAGNT